VFEVDEEVADRHVLHTLESWAQLVRPLPPPLSPSPFLLLSS